MLPDPGLKGDISQRVWQYPSTFVQLSSIADPHSIWFAGQETVHRGENPGSAARNVGVGGSHHEPDDVGRAFREYPQQFRQFCRPEDRSVSEPNPMPGVARRSMPRFQGAIPRHARVLRPIDAFDDLEARRFECPVHFDHRRDVLERNTVHQLLLDGKVLAVAGIEPLRHAHFLTPEKGAGFQHPENLGERARLVRRVACRFDGVAPVKRTVLENAHVHEVARDTINRAIETRFGVQRPRPPQLDFADIDPDHPDIGLLRDPTHGVADSATDIDHRHPLLQRQFGDHVTLMSDLRVCQAFPGCQRREVQSFAPTVHHEFVAKVVVFPNGFSVVVPVPRFLRECSVGPAVEVFHATDNIRPTVRGLQDSG